MAHHSQPPQLDVLVEIPKGSRNKYEHDKKTGRIRLDRMLFSSVHYPTDYGYIMHSLAEDGDPLDALVLVWEPTFPGCVVTARPVGMFDMTDEKGPDEKILCVPMGDPMWAGVKRLEDVPGHLLKEIEEFFRVYKELEGKKTQIHGWKDYASTMEVITASLIRARD
ncbi:MAG TPA: inorganic diphosphatase [candidate division Zixibacteria bacterium]|nr:inorganic diphosphatase [candidate division Zixibacteria bacterium]